MTYIPVELRRKILELSAGCCEYCRVHQSDYPTSYHIEHIIAIAHAGQTVENNLAYSCSRCNQRKGTNIAAADPTTGEPVFLFHPRRHQWEEHFSFDENGYIVGKTPEGRATVLVLILNEDSRVQLRRLLIQLGSYPCETNTREENEV
jgi:hypothetical protein